GGCPAGSAGAFDAGDAMKSDPLITFRRKPASLDCSALTEFAVSLRDRVAKGREFHCLVTGDAELRRLNRDFRHKDAVTDVLSFPAHDGYLGDIAVSLGRARAQAKEFGHSADDEIRILMLHGLLHLTGLDHESDNGEMRRAELRWRKRLRLPVSLI